MSDDLDGVLVEFLDDWSDAIVSNDAAAIGQFTSDDWVIVGPDGVGDRERFLEAVESGTLTHEWMTHDVERIRIYGDTAVVTSRGRNEGTFEGRSFESDEWTTDVLRRVGDSWSCVLTQLSPVVDE